MGYTQVENNPCLARSNSRLREHKQSFVKPPFDEDAQPGTNEKNSDDDDKFIGEMRKTKGGKDTIFNIRVSPHKACKKQ